MFIISGSFRDIDIYIYLDVYIPRHRLLPLIINVIINAIRIYQSNIDVENGKTPKSSVYRVETHVNQDPMRLLLFNAITIITIVMRRNIVHNIVYYNFLPLRLFINTRPTILYYRYRTTLAQRHTVERTIKRGIYIST